MSVISSNNTLPPQEIPLQEESPSNLTKTQPPITALDSSEDVEEPPVEEDAPPEEKTPDWQSFIEGLIAEGVTPKEAAAYVKNQTATAYDQTAYTLASDWDCSPKEVQRRMSLVYQEWEKLPADQKEEMDSIAGAKKLWTQIERGLKTGNISGAKSSPSSSTPRQSQWLFTEDQIEKMSEEEYARKSRQIERAYAENRVKLKY